MAAWIRIRTGIPNADPDPGGLNKAKKEGKYASKRQIIGHKKDKSNVIGIKYVLGTGICYFISLKVSIKR
jgi:hypothetical protein